MSASTKPLPEIVCKNCNYVQIWRGQKSCIHCGRNMSNWSVASQLKLKEVLDARQGLAQESSDPSARG